MCIQIVQIWHCFVTTVTFDCVSPSVFIGKLRMAERTQLGLWFISTGKGCVTIEITRPDTNRQLDSNGDLCCQSVTSKLLFLIPYTFHRTCNLIGKSLTPRWNCLSCFSVAGCSSSIISINSLSRSAIFAAKVKGLGTIFQFLPRFVPNNFHLYEFMDGLKMIE